MHYKPDIHFLIGILLIFFPLKGYTQSINSEEKSAVIKKTAQILQKKYIYPEKAEKASGLILQNLETGKYDSIHDPVLFSDVVTADIRTLIPDKHLGLINKDFAQLYRDSVNSLEKEKGVLSSKILENDIGYLEITSFTFRKSELDKYLEQISTQNTIVIDLRKNSGGNGNLSTYLMSYFMEGNLHFADWVDRNGKKGSKIFTHKKVGGDRLLETPLYILISKKTFSAAEALAYNLQALDRATIVGEKSAGGAHPKTNVSINKNFYLSLPGLRSENTITHSDWEQTGVIPDVSCTSEEALEIAISEAKKEKP